MYSADFLEGTVLGIAHLDLDPIIMSLINAGSYQIKTNPIMITGEASSNTFTGVYTFVR